MGDVAYIGIGSNIDAVQNSVRSLEELGRDSRLAPITVSSLYLTSPISPVEQRDFLNYVAKVSWAGSILELLDHLQSIENRMGRKREIPLGPRTIDLDILFFGDNIINTPLLTVPHPRLHQRKFVLVPCLEIDPNLTHPLLKHRLSDLLADLGPQQKIEIFERAGWPKRGQQ
jgi:2-amino-4-hydroxy-6-hydroxymethyldihydropteridine diphosphokinase